MNNLENNQRQIMTFPDSPGASIDAVKATGCLALHNSAVQWGKAFVSFQMGYSTNLSETIDIISDTFTQTIGQLNQALRMDNLNERQIKALMDTETEMLAGLHRMQKVYQRRYPQGQEIQRLDAVVANAMNAVVDHQDFVHDLFKSDTPREEHEGKGRRESKEPPVRMHAQAAPAPVGPAAAAAAAPKRFQEQCAAIANHDAFTARGEDATTPGQGIADFDPDLWSEQIFAFPGEPFQLPEGRSLIFFAVGEAVLTPEEFERQALSGQAENPLVTRHSNVLPFHTEGHTGLILLNKKNQPVPISIQRSETGALSFVPCRTPIIIPKYNEPGISEYSVMKLPAAVDGLSDEQFYAKLNEIVPTINQAGIRYRGAGNSNRSVDAMAYALYEGLRS